MAPKKQPTKAEPKQKADNVDDNPLQAVILADSYNRRFEVLCLDQPRILLPLCSVPLLAWTLESLASSKVKQVFIFCGAHSDKIRDFVNQSPFQSMLDIHCLSSNTARSAGDALRELDSMHVLNPDNPFILIHNPLVSNYDISQMVDAHKRRREADKELIMTMGVGRGGRAHPESPVMMVHPPSSRLLHYDLNAMLPRRRRVEFPANLFLDPWPATMDEFEVWSGTSGSSSRGGYRDLGVDICEADVPALCTENFDYHDLRRHFVRGLLMSELLGKRINYHLVGGDDDLAEDSQVSHGQYVERIRDTRTYGEITQDILRRWAFPLVPDISVPGGAEYELRRGNIYVARDNVLLSRTTALQGPLLIGSRCSLGHHTQIQQSTLGSRCQVGANTTIRKSYVFTNVRIGAGCLLDECMIGDNVIIGDGAVIGKGTLIGNDVTIGPGVHVPEFSRVGRERYAAESYGSDSDSDEEDEEDLEAERNLNLAVLGSESIGFLWPSEEEEPDEDSDDEGEDPYEHPHNKQLLQLGRSLSNVSLASEVSLSTLSVGSSTPSDEVVSLADSDSDLDVGRLDINDGPSDAFFSEIRSSLARAYEEGHAVKNALLELKTLVMGYNSGIDPAREEVVNFLMSKVSLEGGAGGVLSSATAVWRRWGAMAANLARDLSDIALDVQTFCVRNPAYAPWFGMILRGMYDSDTVDEEALIEWRSLSAARGEGAKEGEREKFKEVFAKGKQYVDVLEQMDSEDDDDDDDEEEEEESDSDDE